MGIMDIVIPIINKTGNHPGATRHPSIEGNKTEPSVFAFTARSAKIIPLYGGVPRRGGVVINVHLIVGITIKVVKTTNVG
jgi:hypothetical protein